MTISKEEKKYGSKGLDQSSANEIPILDKAPSRERIMFYCSITLF